MTYFYLVCGFLIWGVAATLTVLVVAGAESLARKAKAGRHGQF